jgi:MFS family permease
VQGLGAAGMMAVNAALVRLIYPSGMLGRGIALNSVVVATSSVAGPTVAAAGALGHVLAMAVRGEAAAGAAGALAGQRGRCRTAPDPPAAASGWSTWHSTC